MLTDADAAAAKAEYDALPGTPPDGYSSISFSDCQNERSWFHDRITSWREDGMTWARMTRDVDHQVLWVEVWKTQPRKEAPFDPPYTLAHQSNEQL